METSADGFAAADSIKVQIRTQQTADLLGADDIFPQPRGLEERLKARLFILCFAVTADKDSPPPLPLGSPCDEASLAGSDKCSR
ncbi:Gag polyprotein [Frankliniella fusca]|uniref:Gag polyprotein n=1 Tax=Frankliniella fusca TaxID=407009 RepID=A0AAE1HXK9_9NEOP|nr:Gag polyprotein [Frankliniella fusca]